MTPVLFFYIIINTVSTAMFFLVKFIAIVENNLAFKYMYVQACKQYVSKIYVTDNTMYIFLQTGLFEDCPKFARDAGRY